MKIYLPQLNFFVTKYFKRLIKICFNSKMAKGLQKLAIENKSRMQVIQKRNRKNLKN